MSNYNRITFKERVRIEAGIYAHESFSKIAEDLGRSTSSIIREVKQNRIKVKMPYVMGRDCIYTSTCAKKNMCDEEFCDRKCRLCLKVDCTKICDRVKNHECPKYLKPPFVCSTCSEKNKKKCIYDKYYYIAEKADAKAKATRSESREGIRRFRKLFPVILTDNGRCFKNALELEYTKNGSPRTKIFYCDPQASWQKPHIEKNHEYIRYVIPRGNTFKGYTQEDMTLIANHINSTIRAGLNYKSPYDLVETEDMKKLLEVLNMSPVAADDVCLSPKLLRK